MERSNCFFRMMSRPAMDGKWMLLSMADCFFVILRKENSERTDVPKVMMIPRWKKLAAT